MTINRFIATETYWFIEEMGLNSKISTVDLSVVLQAHKEWLMLRFKNPRSLVDDNFTMKQAKEIFNKYQRIVEKSYSELVKRQCNT